MSALAPALPEPLRLDDVRESDRTLGHRIAGRMRRITTKARAFLREYANRGFDDAAGAAAAAGYAGAREGYRLVSAYRDVIEDMRLRSAARERMTVAEAQALVASIARDPDVSPRDRTRAAELFMRSQGALSERTDARDGARLARDAEELVSRIRKVAKTGHGAQRLARALAEPTAPPPVAPAKPCRR